MTTSNSKKKKDRAKSPAADADIHQPLELHSASDELNAALLTFEEALASLNLGVSASVKLSTEYPDSDWRYAIETCLAFRKVGRHWVLLAEVGPDGDPENWSSTPLANASRETRLLAVEQLEELHKELLREYNAECERVRASIDYVNRLTRKIRGVEGLDSGG